MESAVLMSKYIFKRPRRAQLAYWAACTQIGILAPRTQESAEAVEEGMLDQDADGFQVDADSDVGRGVNSPLARSRKSHFSILRYSARRP